MANYSLSYVMIVNEEKTYETRDKLIEEFKDGRILREFPNKKKN